MKGIMILEAIIITGDQIGELREKNKYQRNWWKEYLPEYSIYKYEDIYVMDDSDAYLQFVDEGKKEYLLFGVTKMDNWLEYECDNAGFFDTFEGCEEDLYNILKPKAYKLNESFGRLMPSIIVVVDYDIECQESFEGDQDAWCVINSLKDLDSVGYVAKNEGR